jgi:hypothetical protein
MQCRRCSVWKWKSEFETTAPRFGASLVPRSSPNSLRGGQALTLDLTSSELSENLVDLIAHDKLSPLVNRPGEMDKAAVAELRSIVEELRSLS